MKKFLNVPILLLLSIYYLISLHLFYKRYTSCSCFAAPTINFVNLSGVVVHKKFKLPFKHRTYSTAVNTPRNEIEKELLSNRKAINITHILNYHRTLEARQLKIENYFNYEHEQTLIQDLKNNKSLLNGECFNILINSFKTCERILNAYKNEKNLLKGKKYKEFIIQTPSEIIFSIVLTNVLPNILKNDIINDQHITMLCERIGNKLIKGYYQYEYEKYRVWEKELTKNNSTSESIYTYEEVKFNKGLSFTEFKKLVPLSSFILDDVDYIKYGYDMLEIISTNSKLFTIKTDYNPIEKTSLRYMIIDDEAKNVLLEYTSDDVNTFPMITKPVEWKLDILDDEGNYNITNYGGYLLNETERQSFIHKNYKNVGFNKFKDNKIINTLNYLQSIEFKVNKDVLNVITDSICDGSLDNILSIKYHPLSNKIKELKGNKEYSIINNILKVNSKVFNNINIITNALILRNMTSIYFPIFVDWRGRFYCRTASFSYQGGDIAKSLFLFKNGTILNDNGVEKLKLYIASCYGLAENKSNISLLKWLESNIENIIDIDNKFWLKGKDPLQSLAGSIELNRYMKSKKSFKSYLPIYMDATCNGIQHLSSLAGDINLAKHVNLLKSSDSDIPHDLYTLMADKLNESIKNYVEENPSAAIITKININRSFVKRGIMTIPYGVTIRGIRDQLLTDHFERLEVKDSKNRILFKINDSFVDNGFKNVLEFNLSDVNIIAKLIYNSLFKDNSALTNIVKYFKSINSVLHKIKSTDGLVWIAPSGVIIEQKYVDFKSHVLYTNILGKKKTITLNKPVLNKVNLTKQNLGVIPNIIHSLDASNIALLINKYVCNKQIFKDATNILTIHDCFATDANKIDLLTYYIKLAFINMYADNKYLKDFHEHFIYTLKNKGFVISDDGKYICLEDEILIELPQIPETGDLNLKEILESKYFIH